jgi:predicted GNAT family N-acyltransferase
MLPIREASFEKEGLQVLQVRYAVFVQEQGVPMALEQDAKDPLCRHALLLMDGAPVATGRLEADGHIGRVAVLSAHRSQGIGRQILRFLENMAREAGLKRVYLGAQLQAMSFYEKLGYLPYGNVFIEAGIAHQHMQKNIGP